MDIFKSEEIPRNFNLRIKKSLKINKVDKVVYNHNDISSYVYNKIFERFLLNEKEDEIENLISNYTKDYIYKYNTYPEIDKFNYSLKDRFDVLITEALSNENFNHTGRTGNANIVGTFKILFQKLLNDIENYDISLFFENQNSKDIIIPHCSRYETRKHDEKVLGFYEGLSERRNDNLLEIINELKLKILNRIYKYNIKSNLKILNNISNITILYKSIINEYIQKIDNEYIRLEILKNKDKLYEIPICRF